MVFLQQAPPDTTSYMILGYAVIFGVILLYLISLGLRRRNLKRDLETLQDIEQDE